MHCIYCLDQQSTGTLTDEHALALSLGGRLVLPSAACSSCNSDHARKLDAFLASEFPPTHMARTELGLKGHSRKHPEMYLESNDPTLGRFDVILRGGRAGSEFKVRPLVRRQGDSLIALAANEQEALKLLSQATRRRIAADSICNRGTVRIGDLWLKRELNWDLAHQAAAKVLYCYILLELGDRVLFAPSMSTLRNYVVTGAHRDKICPVEAVSEICQVPPHHHLLAFDSANSFMSAVCLFGILWFRFSLDFSDLAPHGRLVGLDPVRHRLSEAITKHNGQWYPRTSIKWGWNR